MIDVDVDRVDATPNLVKTQNHVSWILFTRGIQFTEIQ